MTEKIQEAEEIPLGGACGARFHEVREVFLENFRSREEIGAAVAVVRDGETVVDLWAGHTDRRKAASWTKDTLVNIFSTTKGLTAVCARRLIDEGRLDPDAPVASYWPEFARAGKERIPVRWLLSHQAGLPAMRRPLPGEALYDWSAMTGALAAEEPWWEPGTKHGYHAMTFGWLVGELIRRISGRSVGTYFREEIAGPLALDLHIGLAEGDHHRVARISAPRNQPPDADGVRFYRALVGDPEGMVARAFTNPPSIATDVNTAAWRKAELPSGNGHGTARALAELYGVLASGGTRNGVPVLSRAAVAACSEEYAYGPDAILQTTTRFGPGFMLSQDRPGASFGPGRSSFGHPGAGGSIAFADPDAGIGFGYVMNRMGPHILLDPRAAALIDAVYRAL
jgi:CubicO group peptidase (beta-lactamase class C family)